MTASRIRRTALLPALVLVSAIGLSACSSEGSAGQVTVLGPWIGGEGGEEGQFGDVLEAFTAKTGIKVNYQGARALPQVLLSNVRGGTPPDVAVLANPGELAAYARNGEMYPLDEFIDQKRQEAFSRQWLLPQEKDGKQHIYTIPIKANLKSIVWFNPKRAPQPLPQTWDGLVDYSGSIAGKGSTPWCIGLGDAPSSGWPGSDLIEDILLQTFGQALYQRWSAGDLPWISDEVAEAWTRLGKILARPTYVQGKPDAALFTDFADAARPMFATPPGCFLDHQASFIMGFYQGFKKDGSASAPQAGVDFDFFPFPGSGNQKAGRLWEASADLAGMFNDTPQARRFMSYLASDEAQQIWPAIPGASAFTVNKNVDLRVYDDDVSRRIAEIFRSGTLCLDAADLMPASMRNAFYRAVLEYFNDPSLLGTLLKKLEKVREGIEEKEWLTLSCG